MKTSTVLFIKFSPNHPPPPFRLPHGLRLSLGLEDDGHVGRDEERVRHTEHICGRQRDVDWWVGWVTVLCFVVLFSVLSLSRIIGSTSVLCLLKIGIDYQNSYSFIPRKRGRPQRHEQRLRGAASVHGHAERHAWIGELVWCFLSCWKKSFQV